MLIQCAYTMVDLAILYDLSLEEIKAEVDSGPFSTFAEVAPGFYVMAFPS